MSWPSIINCFAPPCDRVTDLPVSDSDAAFLEHAKLRLAAIRDDVAAVGPPAWWAGASYYEAFLPIQDQLLQLAQEGNVALGLGSPARAEFARLVDEANNLVLRLQQGSLEYEALRAWFAGNPWERWRLVASVASQAAGAARDAGRTAREAVPDYLGAVLAVVRRYALYLGFGGVGLYLLTRSR